MFEDAQETRGAEIEQGGLEEARERAERGAGIMQAFGP